jgi:hypothetical protein
MPFPFDAHVPQVIEYCLFQPGWFMNYLAGTCQTSKYLKAEPYLLIDHNQRRGRVAGSLSGRITYTLAEDAVNILVKAVEYEGEWPEVGGISGHTLTMEEEIAIGEKVRGKSMRAICDAETRPSCSSSDTSTQADLTRSRNWMSAKSAPGSSKRRGCPPSRSRQ